MLQADGEVWDPNVEANKADPLRPGHIPHQGTQHTAVDHRRHEAFCTMEETHRGGE
jgi:hypothetical protein